MGSSRDISDDVSAGLIVGTAFNVFYCTKCGGDQEWL